MPFCVLLQFAAGIISDEATLRFETLTSDRDITRAWNGFDSATAIPYSAVARAIDSTVARATGDATVGVYVCSNSKLQRICLLYSNF